MGLLDGGAKKLEKRGDVDGLLRMLLTAKTLGYAAEAASALARLGDEATPGLLLAMAATGNAGIPAAFARMGSGAVPALIEALGDENLHSQREAALAFLTMAFHDDTPEEAIAALRAFRDGCNLWSVVIFPVAALGAAQPGSKSPQRLERNIKAALPSGPLFADIDVNDKQAVCESTEHAKLAAQIAYPEVNQYRYWVANAMIEAHLQCKALIGTDVPLLPERPSAVADASECSDELRLALDHLDQAAVDVMTAETLYTAAFVAEFKRSHGKAKRSGVKRTIKAFEPLASAVAALQSAWQEVCEQGMKDGYTAEEMPSTFELVACVVDEYDGYLRAGSDEEVDDAYHARTWQAE